MQKLSHRIALFLSVMLGIVTLAGFVVTQTAILDDAQDNIASDLDVARRVVERQLDQRNKQLMLAAKVLAADFAFREAIASHDRDTVMSALENHGRRIRADAMMLIALDGVISAATPDQSLIETRAPFADLLKPSNRPAAMTSTLILDGRLHQLVVVPVLAPVTIGYVAMAFEVGEAMARDLAELTGMDVSFVSREQAGRWQMLGSSHPALPASVDEFVGGERRDRLVVPLGNPSRSGAQSFFVVDTSLEAAVKRFNDVRVLTGVVGLGCLVVTILGVLVITRSVTRPLAALTAVARRIGDGDYSSLVPIARQDEVGTLATALNAMRNGIAQREHHISSLAFLDGLTGLPNRLAFRKRLSELLVAQEPGASVSVLLLDLDRFRQVNDTIGHALGDELLKQVAGRLQTAIGRDDSLLACFGGDEFALLLPDTTSPGAHEVAARIAQALETPIALDGQLIDVSASIGHAAAPEHATDVTTLIIRADAALQRAKRHRAGISVYVPEKDAGTTRLSMLSELRQAVERHELMIWYQPKLDLPSGRVAGAEALVRWEHPTRGFIRPDEFIPYAEQTGYIREITKWVLRQSCHQLALWRRAGLDLRLSVNLSARDLLRADLPDFIAQLLREESIDAAWLTLEVTESAIMDDPAQSLKMLEALRAMGLTLAIDDFGTGYSSLAYLKSLPVSEMKIDKSFVLKLAADGDDAVIVRSTIELAHNLQLKVVAEGVETGEGLSLLRQWGCDQAQGYFIGRPMPAVAFEQWLEASRDSRRTAAA